VKQLQGVVVNLAIATCVVFASAGQGIDGLDSVAAAAAQEVTAAAQALTFTDITAQAGMASSETGGHGAAWADATGDGLPDLYLTYNDCRTGERSNRFYRNLGGVFVEEAQGRGIANRSGGTHGGAWADLDNDGDYDLLNGDTYAFACPQGSPDPPPRANQVFLNSGGAFVNVTPPAIAGHPQYTRAIFAFDMEADGDLDIFAVNGDRGSLELFADRNELYRNESGVGRSRPVRSPRRRRDRRALPLTMTATAISTSCWRISPVPWVLCETMAGASSQRWRRPTLASSTRRRMASRQAT
jgi:hypothetical protein